MAMVGDGTDDAPALALAGNDLRQVAAVVELSRHTLRIVRQNYGLAIGLAIDLDLDLTGLLAGAGGTINPVVANSARLVNHTPHLPPAHHERRAAPFEERCVR